MERKNEPVKKKVLGRGLSALLTGTTPSAGAPGAGRDPGFLQIPVEKIREFEAGLYKYADLNDESLKAIAEKKELDETIEAQIKKLLEDYKSTVDYLIK